MAEFSHVCQITEKEGEGGEMGKWFLADEKQSNPQHVAAKEEADVLILQLIEDAYYHGITRPYC